jgi:hypothetical protein
MTLIVGLTSKETIWLMGDRRLTTAKGKIHSEEAIKLMEIETMQNDIALIGYAGLGATAKGREISDWMNSALRGRNLPLEDLLRILANVIKDQLPKYLSRFKNLDRFQHNVVIPAFHNNHAQLYSIDLVVTPKTKKIDFRFTKHVNLKNNSELLTTPRFGLAGSGASYLISNMKWMRPLLSLAKKSDSGDIKPEVVANELSKVNFEVSKNLTDKTVGPNSVVIWRNRRQGRHKGGGSHKFYIGDKADRNSPAIHTLAGGMDVKAIADILMPIHMKHFKDKTDIDYSSIDEKLAQIPDSPSENLD